MKQADAVAAVVDELNRATAKFGPFASAHEGHSVIEEEFDELWDEIKVRNPDRERMCAEAKQLAAMSIRFLVDIG